ncbi:MAG: AMP-binding protein [Acidimicrobiales bacterium]|nr:AMP-binding protein [Acidimicrobiales bacterium]
MKVPLTIGDFLERAAHVHGDRVALVEEPRAPGSLGRLSYTQLHRRALGMATALERMGVGLGERVALVTPNSGKFLVSYFGVSGFGRILVPINFRLTADEIAYVVDHSGSDVLLIDPELDGPLAGVQAKQRVVLDGVADAELFAECGEDGPRPSRWEGDEDAVATLNYTSGTTARPKGVQITHRNAWLNAVVFGWHIGLSERDVLLHTLPMFHCNGWGVPYAATAMGARHVILRRVDGEEILRRVEAEGVTIMCGAPAVVHAVLDAASARRERGEAVPGRDQVRVVVAGAPPPSKTVERVERELGWEFIQIYGLTETTPLLTVNRALPEWDGVEPSERARRLSRQGVPAVGVRLSVDDSGEVQARSNHVFAGYWNQPEETAKVVVDGWFKTGDGAVLEGPYVVVTDRKKDVIISGGENVSSIEVEDLLYQHPGVAEVAVIGVPDDRWGETVKALVVPRGGAAPSEQELIEFCRSRMAHFKCPTSVELRDSLPRTATGKLQKFKLREPYWEGRERQVN